ncbi:MAG: hypothetical protein ACXAC5_04275 [Promethearchaeota archaeon]|jgi:hypothetical protein
MYKLIYASNEEKKKHEKLFGMYNDFPPGWEEITEGEFAQSGFGRASIRYVEYRQMMRPKHLLKGFKGNVSAHLFHIDNGVGYAIVQRYWDKDVKFFKFDCFNKLKELFDNLPIIEDSTWDMNKGTSIIRRGIKDYDRVIKFERDLTEEEMDLLKQYLARDNCPGWTGIHVMRLNSGVYKFSTTMDSSD